MTKVGKQQMTDVGTSRMTEEQGLETSRVAPPRLRYMPGLDGLRGLAVAAVLLFHGAHLRGGYLGVDLFFVLSGFLITSLLLGEGASGSIDLLRFWGHRARRLLPALGVILLGVAAYARFVARPEELHRLRWDGLATIGYVMNWREVFSSADYWELFTAPSMFNHTWSLAIEEQFYLIWPLVFLVMLAWCRRGRPPRSLPRAATLSSMGLAVLSLGWAAVCQRLWGWNRVYMGTDTRAFAILCGATLAGLTAWHGQVRGPRARRRLEAAGFLGAIILGVAWATMTGGTWVSSHGGLALCSLAAAAVIAAVAHPRPGLLSRALSIAPLRWLGLISYGVYLYHWPIFVWLDARRVGIDGWALFGFQVGVTLVVATASYHLIEQPIRRRSHWTRPAGFGLAFGSFGVVIALLVTSTVGFTPAPEQADESELLVIGDASGPRIMLTGNSIVQYLAHEGFGKLRSDPQFALRNRALAGCSYPGATSGKTVDGEVSNLNLESCNRDWEESARKFRPSIVLYARDATELTELYHDGRYIPVCSAEFHDWYADLLRADIRSYARLDARVGLVTSLPMGTHGWGEYSGEGGRSTVACTNAVLRDVAAEFPDEVTLIDLYGHLCDSEGTCREELDGVELRADGVHFRDRAAPLVAQWILSQVGIETWTE